MRRWLIGLMPLLLGAADDEPATTPILAPAPALLTVAERSGYTATARHDEVLSLCRALDERSESVTLTELGRSGEDRPIPLLLVASPPVATPEAARASGKLVVLLVGNIHAGEVCGKEALPMLVRELTDGPGHPLLKDLILAVVPNYNPDGNERVRLDNRPGQAGPALGMGQRGNAAGLDLNRDFVKLDAPETRALVRFLNAWDPHLVIDTHTTNGSLHRYILTYQGPQHPAGSSLVREYVRQRMIPAIDASFEQATGERAFYYGNFEDDHTRWTGFPDVPRFGTNYVGMRHRIGILSEAYAYAPYKDRVLATRDFVRTCLEYAAGHRDEIASLLDQARQQAVAGTTPYSDGVPIQSEARPFPQTVEALGYEELREAGKLRAGAPRDYRVEVVQDYRPTLSLRWPHAYLVPPQCDQAIATLRRHGVELEALSEPATLDAAGYRVQSIERSERPYEGHHPVKLTVAGAGTAARTVAAGTVLVRTSQPLGALAALLLEPISSDGLATWNQFDAQLAVGSLFPVLRLETAPAVALVTAPLVAPVPQDQPKPKAPITLDDLLAGKRVNLGGPPPPARWIDKDHWTESRDGRMVKVDARTGETSPFHDPEPLAKALAALPTIDETTAKRIAGLAGVRYDVRPGTVQAPRPSTGPLLAPDLKGVLFSHENDLYYATLDGETATRLTSSPEPEEFAEFSPDSTYVAFVRANDLYVIDLATGNERALTTDGTETLRHGKADWVYFEEIFNRNWKAFWWSPDGKRIAFLELDDAPLPDHAVLIDTAGSKRTVETTPYPRSGEPNPHVRLGVVSAAGGSVAWADLDRYTKDSFLISGVGWLAADAAYAYVQNRTQTWLDLVKVAPDGKTTRLFRDQTAAWIENSGDIQPLDGGDFLYLSERDGWKHLYRYKADGTLVKQLTSGDWEIRSIEALDASAGFLYFTATKDGPLALNLYRVKLDGRGPIERITTGTATHDVTLSPDAALFLDTQADFETPPGVTLRKIDGAEVRVVKPVDRTPLESVALAPRKRVQIPTPDGFKLEAEVTTPPSMDPNLRYPAWFMTYAGPHTPTLNGGWPGARMAMDQALANAGFVVFRMDPRSASGKGATSAHAAYKQLGVRELEDIQTGIAWLKKEYPQVDPERIGMAGHSYGGFITAFAMTHSDLFAAGIAGAPVTDWHDYDSIYTERFMLTPQENPEGYKAGSVVEAAANLKGKLLILHGAIDDNVSLRNTMRLVHALQTANKDFELMIYPSARHGIFGPHYQRTQIDFIRRTLGGPKPKAATARE